MLLKIERLVLIAKHKNSADQITDQKSKKCFEINGHILHKI